MYTERDGAIYNSALLFDRSGEITGIYDKVHPVTSMPDYTVFESGTTPGTEAATFDLDCGRVGIQICFDVGFPETWAVLAQRGARLVFWPSAYHGGLPLQTYASLHRYYVVTSVGRDRSRIIDPCGRVVRETDAQVNVVAYDLNLGFAVCHYDFNYAIPDRIMERYGDRVRVSSYVDDGLFIVEPLDEGITTEALQQEFGFESMQAYYDFHRRGYRSLVEGERPAPQKARHGARAQYRKETGVRSRDFLMTDVQ
jgi:hypothetical protein